MSTIHPLGDRLKVLPLKRPEMTRGGVVMPENSIERERPTEGVVLAVGRGRLTEAGELHPLECEEGDVVCFGKFAGVVVFDQEVGHDVLLMREDEALGRKRRDELPVNIPGDPREHAELPKLVEEPVENIIQRHGSLHDSLLRER